MDSINRNFLVISVLLICITNTVNCQYTNSICHTYQYRSLSLRLQNEHQCMILEKLQQDFDAEKNEIRIQYNALAGLLKQFQTNMIRNIQSLSIPGRHEPKGLPILRDVPLVRDCSELYMNGITLSGVYAMRLPNRNILNVWCDMDTDDGGWMVIQRRMDGSVNFTRHWVDYAFGFGNVNSEYWLGNENMYWITTLRNYTLRIDLWDWEENHVYAIYDTFIVESEKNQYRLKLGKYSGTAGDALTPYHNNMPFSTIDSDNDEWNMSCAKKDQAGWWFRACGFASLNSLYIHDGVIDMTPDGLLKGIIWYQWKNDYKYSMKRTEMKIKPLVQVKIDREKMKAEESLKEAVDSNIDDTTAKNTPSTTETVTSTVPIEHTETITTAFTEGTAPEVSPDKIDDEYNEIYEEYRDYY